MFNFVVLIESKYVFLFGNLWLFDFCVKMYFFLLDVISDVLFGKVFGFLVEDRDLYQFVEINDFVFLVMNFFQVVLFLINIVYCWLFNLVFFRDVDGVGFGWLMGYVVFFVRFGGFFVDSLVGW